MDDVIEAARRLCHGRNAHKIATQVAYFENRRDFMRYDRFQRFSERASHWAAERWRAPCAAWSICA